MNGHCQQNSLSMERGRAVSGLDWGLAEVHHVAALEQKLQAHRRVPRHRWDEAELSQLQEQWAKNGRTNGDYEGVDEGESFGYCFM